MAIFNSFVKLPSTVSLQFLMVKAHPTMVTSPKVDREVAARRDAEKRMEWGSLRFEPGELVPEIHQLDKCIFNPYI